MEFHVAKDAVPGIEAMSAEISAALASGRPVLWLVCGGSNIPAAVEIMKAVRAAVPKDKLVNLTVSLTDERHGPVGHDDSNWKQLIDAGFGFKGFRSIPVLKGKDMDRTASDYSRAIEHAAKQVESAGGLAIALFGVGADGHIAGILPHSQAVSAKQTVVGYDAGQYKRITLTPAFLKRVASAYLFAFGTNKATAIKGLEKGDISVDDQPAQLLKSVNKTIVFSDQA